MDLSHPSFWEILILTSPCLMGLAIFAYILWSDKYYFGEEEKNSKQVINK